MKPTHSMKYHGQAGDGHGQLSIADGKITGSDIGGAIYSGTYHDQNGKLVGKVTLTAGHNPLVTGQHLPKGTQVPITFSLDEDFDTGKVSTLSVAGHPVKVSFHKL